MKKEIMEKWVTALRSGKYKQGFGKLKQRYGSNQVEYCCLGVLCEILKVPTSIIKKRNGQKIYKYGPNDETLLLSTIDKCGLNSVTGTIRSLGTCLTKMNDQEHYNFNELADIIEKHWEEL